MGPTAGSGGLGLIVGVLEGAMGDLVGLRAFPGAADHDVVCGGRVNHRIFYQILAISLVTARAGRRRGARLRSGGFLTAIPRLEAPYISYFHTRGDV
jgi:hypothetical protein